MAHNNYGQRVGAGQSLLPQQGQRNSGGVFDYARQPQAPQTAPGGSFTDKPFAMQQHAQGPQHGGGAPSMAQMIEGMPGFNPAADESGRLKDPFSVRLGQAGIDEQTRMATAAPGESAWEQMMMGRQGTEESTARDTAQRQGAQFGRDVWNRMAMRGGVGAGARERATTQGQRQMGQSLQGVARGGAMQRADIGLGAEKMRQGLLSQVAGREQQSRMGEQNQMFMERQAQRNYEMEKFRQQMAAEAAQRQSEAISHG